MNQKPIQMYRLTSSQGAENSAPLSSLTSKELLVRSQEKALFMRLLYFLVLLFSSCSQSPLNTGIEADNNKYNLMYVQVGMTEKQVIEVMGPPYTAEAFEKKGMTYDVWYYVTHKTDISQTKMLPRNFTPLVFRDGYLEGYGYRYLKEIRGDPELQDDYDYHEKNRYTNDKEEWPSNKHGYVPPNPPKANEEELRAPKSRGQDPMPTYEDETKKAEPEKKKEKQKRGTCPEKGEEKRTYWWD